MITDDEMKMALNWAGENEPDIQILTDNEVIIDGRFNKDRLKQLLDAWSTSPSKS